MALAVSPAKPQAVQPKVECLGTKADGSFYAWFSYHNKNKETVTIPVGDDNRFDDVEDRGQPTVFEPGKQDYAFYIEFTAEGTNGVVDPEWTLTYGGRTQHSGSTRNNPCNPALLDGLFSDLSLGAEVSDDAPEVGQSVTVTLALTNHGPAVSSSATVTSLGLPASVRVLGASGDGNYAAGIWSVGHLAVGETATLTLEVVADDETSVEAPFEITAAAGLDPNSTPGNGMGDENDYTAFAISPTPSSGGSDGGLESNGSLATLLGRRDVTRMLARSQEARLGLAPMPLVPLTEVQARRSMRGSALDLQALVPTTGPEGTTGYLTTPEDLLQITNATSILAADYLQEDGDRIGVVLAALTPAGQTYDHTKAICDRVKGSTLDDVRLIDVHTIPFVLLRVGRPDGSVDYAVSFVAYPQGDTYVIDSRFRAEEYAIAQGEADDVLNIQVWGSTPEAAVTLAEGLIDGLRADQYIDFRAWGDTPISLPAVYVHGGEYAPGRLLIDIANTTGEPQTVRLSGTTTDVEQGERTSIERTLTIPADGLMAQVETGAIFDAGFSVVADGEVADFVYLADGVWTFTSGDAADALDYTVEAGGLEASHNVRPVERDARLAGTTGTWAGLFRSINPGSRPADLSAFSELAFQARGQGRVQVVIEKTSTNGVEPFHAWIDLTDDLQTVTLPFADLERAGAQGGFTAEDVTLVAFYTYAEGGSPDVFEIDVRDLRFENSQSVATEGQGETTLDLSVAPNPSRGDARVRFSLPAATDVSVEVYDLLGRRVATLAQGSRSAGAHTLDLPTSVAAGTYLVRLQAGAEQRVQRITRLP